MPPSKKSKRKPPAPESYRERSYRCMAQAEGLVSSLVTVRETDLHILAARPLEAEASHLVHHFRNQLENHIAAHPAFLSSLVPLPRQPLAPPIIRDMLRAGEAAGVGPMAAVAGVVAEYVGRALMKELGLEEIIVENGGDIFLARSRECHTAIFAGQSPLSGRLGLRIAAQRMPLGVCTSSGTVGHSLSLGKADSVTVLASSTALADAAATRLGNEVGSRRDIKRALAAAREINNIAGVVVVCGEQLGAWGEVDLVGL